MKDEYLTQVRTRWQVVVGIERAPSESCVEFERERRSRYRSPTSASSQTETADIFLGQEGTAGREKENVDGRKNKD